MDRAIACEFGFAITGTHSRGSSISTGSALYIADTGEFRVGRRARRRRHGTSELPRKIFMGDRNQQLAFDKSK
jgi:hypothetical protein